MHNSEMAPSRSLEERYEALKQSAAWFWVEGDQEAEAAVEQEMSRLWEALHADAA